ncbi:MAG TPA: type VI secretion system baseplate subunit TssG [Plasticicumulans sp.]|uniref:type VI secretion system baseplate subunit TssG n=1 Tax=Plasticicumulans sp. TaxID=2307179 RepID=UPI002CFD6650|nr:type VI secretion system baseplate subunit TssG [Plasticicumulans sp.]HMV38042.1 type VI secretion system baseplate subunit TssG [Plasticicumulans sp.]HMW28371.1 type VI secretion system baseplate subunit TssG [Plasticicumulans sp.]HMW42521.1 type VI secretion system baseplate subunit TssG [Plasticicumulans sp.]HMZ09243.1 type VI secretion system baseplate subunit TssG [Plasticicumulans sp.]HNF64625.1 type VI secretion system baseplate subunit TssG [Plasticicumulans sp.]
MNADADTEDSGIAPALSAADFGVAPPVLLSPVAEALFTALAAKPWDFDLWQALRRIECAFPDKPRLGRSFRVADDPVRLSQPPHTTFVPSTIAAFERPSHRPARLASYAFGLFGPHGPLPLHLSEHARERQRNHRDPTFARFADIFHHRLMSLFWRAWADAQPTVGMDRPGEDRFARYVGSLAGYGDEALRDRDVLGHRPRLHFAGLLGPQARHPDGLRAILADYLGLPVRIGEYIGHWLELPPPVQCRLGDSRASGTLGVNAVIGTRVWDRQYKFRVVLGPLTLADYERLLPGGASLARLRAWVRSYVGEEYAWDARLILARPEVPEARLGGPTRLGWTTWIGTPGAADPADLQLQESVMTAPVPAPA